MGYDTHFHWDWGEMNLTLEDVFALTGLPFTGEILSPNLMRRITLDGLEATLGWKPDPMFTDGTREWR